MGLMSGSGHAPSGEGERVHVRHWGAISLRLLQLLVAEPWQLGTMLACTVASVALHVMGPWQLGRATDLIFSSVTAHRAIDYPRLAQLLVLVAGLYAGAAVLNWVQARLSVALLQRTVRGLRQQTEDKLARLPLAWFDQQPRGEVLSRVTNDIDNISESLQQLLSQLLMSMVSLVGVLVMMVFLSPRLTLIAVLAVLASVGLTAWLTSRSQSYFTDQWRYTGLLNGAIEEDYSGHMLVKVFCHQAQAHAEFDRNNQALYRSSFVAEFLSGVLQPGILFFGNLVFVGVAIVGGLGILTGQISLGLLQAFVQYSRQLTQPMFQMSGLTDTVQSALASTERVFELLDAPEMGAEPENPAVLPAPRGHIVFENVTFRYRPEQALFEKVNLEILPGQTMAIVGPTGAGKTTLVNLLLRFYEIDAGCIRFDGVDTRSLAREDLRRHFGVVPQDAWLFAGSIRDNIAYGKVGATDTDVLAAAQACHVDDFVRALPQGFDTLIDENGGSLSAGQQQLLTIARAFIAQPSVLILDEATSAVDTRTERLVQQAMARLRVGRTSFVIAHRLSTILDADAIVYMENGNVLEQGSHAALVQAKGHYWQLYQAQFQGQ